MNGMARLANWLRLAALGVASTMMVATTYPVAAGVDLPKLEKGKGEKCVEDTQFMRKNHMDLLKHQRDDTMRKGIRTTKHSLKKCVECHASEKTGSVAATKEDFCAACHSYASVKLDCWDCHATKPGKQPVQKSTSHSSSAKNSSPSVSPLMASSINGGNQ
jgi:hypothetical protein